MKSSSESGFTLLELLVVIAIIGALAGVISLAINTARVKARDAKRSGDMRQFITALEQYYIAHGVYPTGTVSAGASGAILTDAGAFDMAEEVLIPNYVPIIPQAPIPADGSCGPSGRGGNDYWYDAATDGLTYTLTFCLGRGSETWPEGIRYATPEGVK